jgi:hypothetical protein
MLQGARPPVEPGANAGQAPTVARATLPFSIFGLVSG